MNKPLTMSDLESDLADEIEINDEERTRCEVWTRVMGYHRPVASFNTGKKGEAAERVYFDEAEARLG
ncbi:MULTISPECIES: anaerobic ribonucleoside-triphosphate reductase [Paracoccaceae]|uniref:Anaerobic ribonucleoside-triphosphate reductase n=2 Tax=Paracoccaceae TaxID=31989 RepID=A0A1N7K090_9RHOB|nr:MULTISPECIES: anaerobic ribonucleoside-triphosphate reductase [Paracoccaceae]TCO69464.1 anaerobic ribonucleoside-triphosphate reductase-like protein [Rhodovulum euryhalinum]SIS54864.1 Anaerobic ribonucleoside-triphosphate reductase [Phaeovulum vinaykumarii]SOB92111.1 anaerobic ribonucleoside-triphosphate reductase-like protein [Phaeovulum vinaykumarii]